VSGKVVVRAERTPVVSQPVLAAPLEKSAPVLGSTMPEDKHSRSEQAKAKKRFKVPRIPKVDWWKLTSIFEKWIAVSPRQFSRSRVSALNLNQLQPELSLDAVKVVRNDLNDADLEVVAIKVTETTQKQQSVPINSGFGPLTQAKQEATSPLCRETT